MRGQFVRAYIGLFLVLTAAALAFSHLVLGRFETAVDLRTEQFMNPLVVMVRERIANAIDEPEEQDAVLESINLLSSIPVHFSPRYEQFLTREQVSRINSGKAVVVRRPDSRSVYVMVAGGRVADIGPIPFENAGASRMLMILPTLITLLLIGAIIYFLIRPIERRISALSNVADDFGAGKLDARVKVGKGGSLDVLESSFNQMAGRIQNLVSGQKEFLRAVSHDLRTPLARLFFTLDTLKESGLSPQQLMQVGRLDSNLVVISDLVRELLDFLRLEQYATLSETELVNLDDLVRDIFEGYPEMHPHLSIDYEIQKISLQVNRSYLRRALTNLVENALVHAKSKVQLRVEQNDRQVRLLVEDDGLGVVPEERDRIFEPFYRVEKSRRGDGAGLGLSITKIIMNLHGGNVEVGESKLGGAAFCLAFPLEQPVAN